ncbi:RagB/SusD family nutrient uptake outer membrane protein [Maribacter sp. 2307ULW6-5]|uniref:RagB/SusD family nutrient uptake outer membrane protein n=1 Tax=Maribacter sp. 2307ULW6-5 TaxID=3386275 RepID=UPI0039BC72D4
MKNTKTYLKGSLMVVVMLIFSGCNDYLEEEVFTEFDPGDLLQTEQGIERVLIGAYNELHTTSFFGRDMYFTLGEFPTDIATQSGGGFERTAILYVNYEWDPAQGILAGIWNRYYRAIRNANSLLDNIGNVTTLSEEKVARFSAEAAFIRADAYFRLYDFFGPVPLVTTTESLEFEVTRSSEDEMLEFLISELNRAAENLPVTVNARGRVTKGAALSLLTKVYLHAKQWQNSANAAQEVIDLGVYQLFPDIETLFSVDNEDNDEFIYVHPAEAQPGEGHVYMPHAFPPRFPIQPNWENFGAQFRTLTSFVNSFEPNDRRLNLILREFTDINGELVQLVEDENGNPLDNARSFKYVPDPNANARWSGNDQPVIRYADILLSRAEALNEINGPNAESIELINQVRQRAGASLLQLADFSSTEALRDHILAERGWELFSEGKRRQDLIRHGKLISNAVARGKNAEPFHELYPLPQREMDANVNLEQNPGY